MQCSCGGAWLAEETLAALVALGRLPWRPRTGVTRPCPMCHEPMQIVSLANVVLDRCPPHGVWFDKHELASVVVRMRAQVAKRITPVLGSRTGLPPQLDRRQQARLLSALFALSNSLE
jgi:Zn-finger nucleic acid-binding protein